MADRLILDAGCFEAYERGERRARSLIDLCVKERIELVTSAAVVAQIWRGTARQASVHRLLDGEAVVERILDGEVARAIGARCASSGSSDVVDAHVALLSDALDAPVVTSDGDDFARLGVPASRIVTI